MSQIAIHQFDTARAITDTLEIGAAPIDLTGCTLKIRFYDSLRRTTWERTGTILTAAAGTVSYQLIAADVQYQGDVEFEWVITYPDASKLTVPTIGRNKLTIYPAIVVPLP